MMTNSVKRDRLILFAAYLATIFAAIDLIVAFMDLVLYLSGNKTIIF